MKTGVALAFLGLAAIAATPAQAATATPTFLGYGIADPTGALATFYMENFDGQTGVTPPAVSPISASWTNGAATFNVNPGVTSYGLVVEYPGNSGIYAPPAGIPNGGDNFFSVRPPVPGTSTVTFTGPGFDSLGLYWGSIDSYNSISFYDSNGLLATVLGSQLLPADGNQSSTLTNGYVVITLDALFTKVVFNSSGNSFEFDNVAWGYKTGDGPGNVPIPGALALFAGGLGVVGLLSRRRRKTIA